MQSVSNPLKTLKEDFPFAGHATRAAFVTVMFCAASSLQVFSLNNGLASTPPMGWNSWNAFQLAIDEGKIRTTADFIADSGMKDAGYEYVVVDAGWKAKVRDAEGRLAADPAKFPSGMKSLAEYVHAKGLKLGIYTDAGSEDCVSGGPGSKDHEEIDARTFAEWGIDYVKEDWCHSEGLNAKTVYGKMSRAIQATGRPMVFSLCEWGDNRPWLWAAEVGSLWRTTGDGKDCWDCGGKTAIKMGGYPRGWTRILDSQSGLEKYAGPGHWNDPDLLLVGLPGLTIEEARAHFSLWAILAAPLIASCDLTKMAPGIADILRNEAVIAIDQDSLGKQGKRVSPRGAHEVWVRQLRDNGVAVVLFNRGRRPAVISASKQQLGLGNSTDLQARDIWTGQDVIEVRSGYSMRVPPHGAAMIRIGAPSSTIFPHWVGSWAAAQQTLDKEHSISEEGFRDASLRQIVHLSIGGAQLRIRISNAFGLSPLRLTSVHVASPFSPAGSKVDMVTDRALTFGGMREVTVPAGSDYLSDAIVFSASPLSDLAITFHFGQLPLQITGHSDSRATAYLVRGESVSADGFSEAKKLDHWYFLAGVDVAASANASSIVILGDSITDGHRASVNANDRWTDQLARRLHNLPATQVRGVLNEGIGGNRLLLDGLGPNAMARFDRDVLSESGVGYLIILEGINDLGTLTIDGEVSRATHEALVLNIQSSYLQMIVRAHDHGVKVIGATLMPYAGTPYYANSPDTEADRQAINLWIRAPGHFDAVIDFDQVVRDPFRHDHILAADDSGDHIHPSPNGYFEMGNAVPLQIFSR